MNQKKSQQDQEEATKEQKKENQTNMASLLEEGGSGVDMPKVGEIKHGTIASISPGQILVGIGAKSEGIISGHEFEVIPPDDFAAMQEGQEILVYVVNPEDQNGNVILSYERALEETSWLEAERLLKSKEAYQGQVIGYNRGGLLVSFNKLRGFVPASQFSFLRRSKMSGETTEENFGSMVGQEIKVCVIEVDRERGRLIFSERAASNETRESIRDMVLEKLKEGDVCTGTITSLADFGAFVNINGADGLVHLSEVSWDKIRHPGEVLKVGQQVKVKVISIDRENKRIGLSLRALQEDPWFEKIKGYKVGQLVEGTITRLTKFGAFARLKEDVEGLVHISEISEKHIDHPKELIHEGDILTLRIIKIEPESRRIGLSLKRVESLAYADMDMKALQKEIEEESKAEEQGGETKPDIETDKSKEVTSQDTSPTPEETESSTVESVEEKQEDREEKSQDHGETPAE